MKTYFFLFLSSLLSVHNLCGQSFSMSQHTKVSDLEGCYFDGTKGVNYQFGKVITPHGSCLDIVKNPTTQETYIFIAWWKGGTPNERQLMVSRKKMGTAQSAWQTIQLPDIHFGYQGNREIGDSHNTAAIVVCPLDGTVHLMYDMHAYSNTTRPGKGFIYRNTSSGAAFATQWDSTTFYANKNVLTAGAATTGTMQERITYPGFNRDEATGRIFYSYRFGGSGNGEAYYAIYNVVNGQASWSKPVQFSDNTLPNDTRFYSIYGGAKVQNGRLNYGFSIRYSDFDDLPAKKYKYNFGLYYASLNETSGKWERADGQPVFNASAVLPTPDLIKIADVIDPNGNASQSIAVAPDWLVTANNAIHMMTEKDNKVLHYYRPANNRNAPFQSAEIPLEMGELFTVGNKVYLFSLANGFPTIYETPEGTNNFRKVYTYTPAAGEKSMMHGNLVIFNNKLVYFYMKQDNGAADFKRPIHVLELDINGATNTTDLSNNLEGTLFPNPTDGSVSLKINATHEEKLTLRVVNLEGREFKNVQIQMDKSGGIYKVDSLKALPNGTYLLYLKGEKTHQSFKFVKQ